MSIYPVRLRDWFPPASDQDECYLFSTILSIILHSRCYACDKKLRYQSAVGHHALPWGYGDIWCSWRCCKSGKMAKVDKRRQRRYNRQRNLGPGFLWIEEKCES